MSYLANEALRRIKLLADCCVPDPRLQALAERASISRILLKTAEMQPIDGVDAEYLEARAHIAGKSYDELKPIIGWDLLSRAYTRGRQTRDQVSVAALGGYLTNTDVPTAADALRPTAVCAALGATFIDAKANIAWPRQTAIATAQWLGSESTVVTATGQTLSNLSLTPHTVGSYTEVSRQLLLQADPDTVIIRDLVRAISNAADLAALYGSGSGGQPVGLTLDSGINTFTGTGATITTFVNAFTALGDGLDDDTGGVAANRSVAGLLRQRAENVNSSFTLWQGKLTNGTVINYPARSSTALQSGNAIIGNWKYLVIATWGGGIEIEVNRYGDSVTGVGNFQKGIVGIRALLTMDSGAIYPGAFNCCASVT